MRISHESSVNLPRTPHASPTHLPRISHAFPTNILRISSMNNDQLARPSSNQACLGTPWWTIYPAPLLAAKCQCGDEVQFNELASACL